MRDDLPLPPDAQLETVSDTLIKYRTDCALPHIAHAYRLKMPACGWALEGELVAAHRAVLNYTKGGDKMTLIITQQEGNDGVRVLITLSRA